VDERERLNEEFFKFVGKIAAQKREEFLKEITKHTILYKLSREEVLAAWQEAAVQEVMDA